MTRSLALAGVLTVLLAAPAAAAPIIYTDIVSFSAATLGLTLVEDFESVTPKDTALASFTSNGNTYTGYAPASNPNVWVASPGYTNFGVPVTTTSILTATGDEDFTIDFGSPTTAVGFDTYLNDPLKTSGASTGPATVAIYGATGLLGVYSHTHASNAVGFLGIISSVPITQIRWTTISGGVINTGIDNIVQGTAVPEPTTLLLVGFGVITAAALRRRRRRA